MNNTSVLSTRQQVAALAVEGVYLLPAIILRTAECIGVWWLSEPATTLSPADPMLWLVAGSWLLQGMLLPPLRLGRVAWYQRLAIAGGIPPLRLLLAGFRRWGGAIRWRWQLWWRRLAATVLAALPTAALWGLAHRLSAAEQAAPALVWVGVGALLIPLEIVILWLCDVRYASAPLLLLAGCPTGAVMALAARTMAGHRRDYINLWPAPLPLPGWRVRHIRWLDNRMKNANLSVFLTATPAGGCILPPAPL